MKKERREREAPGCLTKWPCLQIRITNSAYEAYQDEKERVHALAMTQVARDIHELEQRLRTLTNENKALQVKTKKKK